MLVFIFISTALDITCVDNGEGHLPDTFLIASFICTVTSLGFIFKKHNKPVSLTTRGETEKP